MFCRTKEKYEKNSQKKDETRHKEKETVSSQLSKNSAAT